MASFAIVVTADPERRAEAHRSAIAFCTALLDGEHTLERLFFYNAAVRIAAEQTPSGHDELVDAWRRLATRANVRLTACITAAQRRGVTIEQTASGFELAGLGQLADATLNADRTITFNG